MAGRKELCINPDWLIKTAQDIELGHTSLREASMSVPVLVKHGSFRSYVRRPVSYSIVKSNIEKLGLSIDFRRGRKTKPIHEQVKNIILNSHFATKMGSTKTYERIVAQSIYDKVMKTVSHRMVYNTFKENNLLKYTKPLNPSPIQRCRYEADYVDLIWHTDLHNFNDQYLIAFIDDYSRYIVHYELIPNKYAAITSGVLERALANNNRPFSIWTDNGDEFIAEFLVTFVLDGNSKKLFKNS